MSVKKALINTLGDHLDITVPFTKADPEKRTIIGIATADAVDHAGDVVTWSASKKAFATTSAAIREQHQKDKVVGKIVGFEAKSLWDEELQKVVNVIEVEAYISRTAEDTWTKINEGILKGFSIGGNVTKSEERISKSDPTVSNRYITEYTLTELSVVDNPCSPQAKIMSIHKSADSTLFDGMVTEVDTENVFWNAEKQEIRISKDEQIAGFENAGWIETSKSLDDESRAEQISQVMRDYLSITKSDEGGATKDMSEEKTEETAVVEEVQSEEVQAPSEEAVEVSEVSEEGTDITKVINDLKDTIAQTLTQALNKSNEESAEALAQVQGKLEKASGEFVKELTAVKEQVDGLTKSVTSLSEQFNAVEKRIDSVEADTAIKKSGDLGGSTVITKAKEEKSFWNGALSVDKLLK